MRNILCTEDRQCTLEPMAPIINQTGGGQSGLIAAEEDYVIPLHVSAAGRIKKRAGKQSGRGRSRQIGKGKRVQKGKGRGKSRLSRPKAGKRNTRKIVWRKKGKKAAPWIM